ncbi:hypothetical protein NliqN6_6038 [Naganishia liquefaciens]|uniref:DUF1014 domain-containing protein n=1 Tax=Naganishia liquefaciens TaxID=104408 RepID=A0A8H3YJL8_9TREE|nr:hypothetical protein NliqN6_6038 [Naganishia liquefaciens]
MPPAKVNAKKEAGKARKDEKKNAEKEKVEKVKAAKEDEEWKAGAKDNSKKDAARQKAEEAERKKREKEALLKAEEESMPSKPKGGAKKAGTGAAKKKEPIRPAGPGAIAAGGGLAGISLDNEKKSGKNTPEEPAEVHLAATGIDSMLEALELVNARTDKEALGAKAGLIEKHPERRFKAAFEAYLERETPRLKEEHPGLRKQQMHDILFKQFQKAPENPFNQVYLAHNATKEERVAALQNNMAEREKKFQV